VAERDVTELDWWEAVEVQGAHRHRHARAPLLGRGLGDANRTLWAGGRSRARAPRVLQRRHGAPRGVREIGRRLGPFDLTMIEAGAYDALWADVHLGPEQAVLAHRLVRGDVMLPVHWGLFDLALHGWTEPMERVLAAAAQERRARGGAAPGGLVEPRGGRTPRAGGRPCRGRTPRRRRYARRASSTCAGRPRRARP
jgi:L-ascorbate metabolism protein UlaG (beta-lactamase superfamily)